MPDQAPNVDVKGGGKLVYDKARRTIVSTGEPTKEARYRTALEAIAAHPHYTAGGDPDRVWSSLFKRYELILKTAEEALISDADKEL